MAIISSVASAQIEGLLTSQTWWVRSMSDDTLDMEIDMEQIPLQLNSHEEQAVFEPLGRTHPLVITDMIRGERFTFKMFFASKTEYNRWKQLRAEQATEVLQSPYGDTWYMRWGNDRATDLQNTTPPSYSVSIEVIEVDNPDSLIGLQ